MTKKRHLIDRREFVVASSAALATVVAVNPKLFAQAAVTPRRLAVGYAPLDDSAALVEAASIPAGDGGFISRGARVWLSGMSGAPADPSARRAVEMRVYYSYLDGAERRDAPFYAWSGSRKNSSQGVPTSFTVPLDATQKIKLAVGLETGNRNAGSPTTRRQAVTQTTVSDQELPLSLSLQSDPNELKLARGFYVIVPMFDGDSEPRWGTYHLDRIAGRWGLRQIGGTPVTFEHFVLRIDYAKS
jgi:hypothetical protein